MSSQQDKVRTEEELCLHCPLQSSRCPLEVETDEEIREIMELAQVTLLASISLFSVPVTKYTNIYKEVT